MGFIYEAILDMTKEAIVKSFEGNKARYKDVFSIIDKRQKVQLNHPLHAAGYYLNPEFFYSNPTMRKMTRL